MKSWFNVPPQERFAALCDGLLRWPMGSARSGRRLDREVGDHGDNRGTGFRNGLIQLRNHDEDVLLVRDCGDIPHGKRFRVRMACSVLHDGLCATDDDHIFDAATSMAASVERFFGADKQGAYWILRDPDMDMEEQTTNVLIALC